MKTIKKIFLLILIVFLLGGLISIGLVGYKTNDTKILYVDIINKYAEEYKSDPIMIASIIQVESGFDKDAVSPMGAKGLMQILPDTGQWISGQLDQGFESEMLFDPDYNIKLGAYYYEYLYDHFGEDVIALAAYNGGMGNVEEWLNDPDHAYRGHNPEEIPFQETREYVTKVLSNYELYKMFYGDELPEQEKFDNPMGLVWGNYKVFLNKIVDDF